MFKRFSLRIVIVILALGIIFQGLDILDIYEDFRLYLPINIFNTVFISAVAMLLVYIAAKSFTIAGLPELLGLGCAQLAFGIGSLLRGWLLGIGLDIPITIYDSMVLISSLVHLIGGILGMVRLRGTKSELRQKQKTVLFCYIGTLASIALVVLLVFRGVIPSFIVPVESGILLRDVIQGISAVFFFAASFIYFKIYLKSRTDFYYWYFLGLLLFAFGIIFLYLGIVESRIAWLGRVSEYTGNIYFLLALIGAYRLISGKKVKVRQN